MKLEVKDLVGYLPYNLKCKTDIGILELSSIQINNRFKYWFCENNFNNEILSKYNCTGRGFYSTQIKPILFPVTDLTKEITFNNKNFVPLDILWELCDVTAEVDFIEALSDDHRSIKEKLMFAPLTIVQKLLEWKFDIYGLIDAGLAIDINKLDNKNIY